SRCGLKGEGFAPWGQRRLSAPSGRCERGRSGRRRPPARSRGSVAAPVASLERIASASSTVTAPARTAASSTPSTSHSVAPGASRDATRQVEESGADHLEDHPRADHLLLCPRQQRTKHGVLLRSRSGTAHEAHDGSRVYKAVERWPFLSPRAEAGEQERGADN